MLAVMSSLGIQSPPDERAGPAFGEQTGSQLAMAYDPATVLLNAIGSERRADAIVAIDTLVKDKLLLPSSRVGIPGLPLTSPNEPARRRSIFQLRLRSSTVCVRRSRSSSRNPARAASFPR